MKVGTENLAKFRSLCEALDLPRYAGIGLLDSLWRFTETNTPAGDIGRFTDATIARDLDWRGESEKLIAALVDTGWLDEHPDPSVRLAVHDWHEHCEDRIHLRMARARKYFVDNRAPKLARLTGSERQEADDFYKRAPKPCAQSVRTDATHDPCAQVVRTTITSTNTLTREGDNSPDPLADFSELRTAYPEVLDLLRAAHPKAKIPKQGSADELKARDTLAKLVRLDDYNEGEVIGCLRWLFTSEDADAEFWRGNVQAFYPLRKVKDGASKFARIHAAWRKANGGHKAAPAVDPDLSASIGAIMRGGKR